MKRTELKRTGGLKRSRIKKASSSPVRALEQEADGLIQELTCKGHKCAVCGSWQGLSGHHVIGKAQCRGALYWLRHERINVIPLCVDHHIPFAHGKPVEFREWMMERMAGTMAWLIRMEARAGGEDRGRRSAEHLTETIERLRRMLNENPAPNGS